MSGWVSPLIHWDGHQRLHEWHNQIYSARNSKRMLHRVYDAQLIIRSVHVIRCINRVHKYRIAHRWYRVPVLVHNMCNTCPNLNTFSSPGASRRSFQISKPLQIRHSQHPDILNCPPASQKTPSSDTINRLRIDKQANETYHNLDWCFFWTATCIHPTRLIVYSGSFSEICDQNFGQVFDQNFEICEQILDQIVGRVSWAKKYRVQFYRAGGKYYLLLIIQNSPNPKLYSGYSIILFKTSSK